MNGFQTYRGIIPVPEKRVGTEETSPGNPELGFGVAVFGFDGVSVPEMVTVTLTFLPDTPQPVDVVFRSTSTTVEAHRA